MNGGKLYQELVVVGAVARVTEDPATLLQKSTAAQTAAGVPVARGNSNWASASAPPEPYASITARMSPATHMPYPMQWCFRIAPRKS